MALITKTDPVGIDIVVNEIQTELQELSWVTAKNGYENMPRAYKNETSNGRVPELYLNNGEYKEVFYNDEFSATSFFMADSVFLANTGGSGKRNYDPTLNIIFQLDLKQCYPSIAHRADEEAHREVILLLENMPYTYRVNQVVVGISEVYEDLRITQVNFDDMHPAHVFKVQINNIGLEYQC